MAASSSSRSTPEATKQALSTLLHGPSVQWDARSSTAAGDVMAALDRDPHTTVPLLLEKVESPATRERALRLILALALGSLSPGDATAPLQRPSVFSQIAQGLAAIISGKGVASKVLLAACQTIKALSVGLLNASTSGAAATVTFSGRIDHPVLRPLVPLLQPLIRLMHDRSALLQGRRQPTTLTVAASDALCRLLYLIATRGCTPDTDADADTGAEAGTEAAAALWSNMEPLEQYLDLLREWNRLHRELYAVAVQSLAARLKAVKDFRYKADYQAHCMASQGTAAQSHSNEAISNFWASYAPLLLEDDEGVASPKPAPRGPTHHGATLQESVKANSGVAVRLAHLLATMEGPSDKQQGTQEEATLHILVSAGLLLGRLSKNLDSFLDDHAALAQTLYDTLVHKALRYKDGDVQHLAAQIMMHALKSSTTEIMSGDAFVELLDERDGASKAAVALLAQYAVAHPQTALPQVFQRLDSDVRTIRANALDALEAVCATACAVVVAGDRPPGLCSALADALLAAQPVLVETMADLLVDRLADEDLALRVQAAGLFGYLAPQIVIPKLVQLLWDRDTRRRSAAHAALRHLLGSNVADLRHVVVLVDGLEMAPGSPKVRTPADIGRLCEPPVPDSHRPAAEKADVVFKYIKEWAEGVPSTCWRALVPQCIRLVLADPTHMHKVRLLPALANHFAAHQDLVFADVLEAMRGATFMDDPREGVFQRLGPLLVLRALPPPMFHAADPTDKHLAAVAKTLWDRGCDGREALDLRKVCMELFGRFDPLLVQPRLLAHLRHSLGTRPLEAESELQVRLGLLSICSAMTYTASGVCSSTTAQWCTECTSVVLDDCLAKLDCGQPESEKLCAASIQVIAQAMVTALPKSTPAPKNSSPRCAAAVVEIDPNPPITVSDCISDLVQHLEGPNVTLHPYLLAAFQHAVNMTKDSPDRLTTLASRIIPPLVVKANTSATARQWTLVAACLHVLFLTVYALKQDVHPFVQSLGDVALHALHHKNEACRLGGLKLLGALMSAREDLFGFFSASYLVGVLTQLRALSTLDPSAAVQQLATGLAGVFDSLPLSQT